MAGTRNAAMCRAIEIELEKNNKDRALHICKIRMIAAPRGNDVQDDSAYLGLVVGCSVQNCILSSTWQVPRSNTLAELIFS